MDLWNRPTPRLSYAEPLEGRRLLSRGGFPEIPDVYRGQNGAVELIELERQSDEEEDREVAPSELPRKVVAAIQERFPGAKLIEADFSLEDEQEEYGVSAKFQGEIIDLTVTPHGKILEIEHLIASNDVPLAVREWLEAFFPGAEIDEAVIKTSADGQNYEVTFAQPGAAEFEVELNPLGEAPAPSFGSSERIVPPAGVSGLHDKAGVGAFSDSIADENARDLLPLSEVQIDEQPHTPAQEPAAESVQPSSQNGIPPEDSLIEAEAFAPIVLGIAGSLADDALRTAFLAVEAAGWLPELAGVLSELLPLDLAGVEQAIEEILGRIDSIGGKIVEGAAGQGSTLRLAALAVIAAAMRVLLINPRKSRRAAIVAFNAGNSSWSWVLGAARPQRG